METATTNRFLPDTLQPSLFAIALSGYGMEKDFARQGRRFMAHLVKLVPLEQLRALLE